MLRSMPREDRMRLLRFVCSFAWTDLEVNEPEKRYVRKLAGRLRLDPDELRQMESWLKRPPAPELVDPQDVPHEHRDVFVKALEQVAHQDGDLSEEERLTLSLFERLTA